MEETDRIYRWISNVIDSCDHLSHIEPCEVLITFYGKKGAREDLIKALKESLRLRVLIIQDKNKDMAILSKEDEIWEMFKSGKHTIKQISESLDMKILKCQEVINGRLRKNN